MATSSAPSWRRRWCTSRSCSCSTSPSPDSTRWPCSRSPKFSGETARGAAVVFSEPSARARGAHLRRGRDDHRSRPDRGNGGRRSAAAQLTQGGSSSSSTEHRRPGCPRLPASSSSSAASTACGCSPNVTSTRNRSSKRRSASLGWSLSATGHRRWRSCSWSWSNHERDERNHARRAARDPRALARSRHSSGRR